MKVASMAEEEILGYINGHHFIVIAQRSDLDADNVAIL